MKWWFDPDAEKQKQSERIGKSKIVSPHSITCAIYRILYVLESVKKFKDIMRSKRTLPNAKTCIETHNFRIGNSHIGRTRRKLRCGRLKVAWRSVSEELRTLAPVAISVQKKIHVNKKHSRADLVQLASHANGSEMRVECSLRKRNTPNISCGRRERRNVGKILHGWLYTECVRTYRG